MKYTKYTYLYPPRPEKAIPPGLLSAYEDKGWVGQYKKNGTCNVTFVSPTKEITVMTRHNAKHKAWAPTEASNKFFKELPGNDWYVFVSELLHSKTPTIKDTHYIFDILVHNGEHLSGMTFIDRMDILASFITVDDNGQTESTDSYWIVNPNVWIAKTLQLGFESAFKGITSPEDEGLVLKDPYAKLKLPFKKNSNVGWMIKCRKAHSNYGF